MPTFQDILQKTQFKNPDNAKSLQNLFQFVSRNQIIPEGLAELNNDPPGVQALLEAINQGDHQATVFSEDNCYLYLLYLMLNEKVEFWLGMSVYSYLLILMQYTTLQHSKGDVEKTLGKFEVCFLAKNGKLTLEGEKYIASLTNDFVENIYDLNKKLEYFEKIEAYIIALPPAAQWLFCLPQLRINKTGRFNEIILRNLPFCIMNDDNGINYIPSLMLLNFLFQLRFDSPVQMLPIFGNISEATLQRLHAENKHPLPFYAKGIVKNTTDVHEGIKGVFTILLHDLGHVYWGSMLTIADRQFIFNDFAPMVSSIMQNVEKIDEPVYTLLKKSLLNLFDFDLTPLDEFNDVDRRLTKYLARAFFKGSGELRDSRYLGEVESRVYFLLAQAIRSLPAMDTAKRSCFEKVWIEARVKFSEAPWFKAFEALLNDKPFGSPTKSSTPDFANHYMEIHWEWWLDILNSSATSKEIWEKVKRFQYAGLLILIEDYNLKFFHPYLPLTDEKRQELTRYAAKQVEKLNALNKKYSGLFRQLVLNGSIFAKNDPARDEFLIESLRSVKR